LDIADEVIFTGYISGRDKLEFLVDCDVCVFPSRAEQGLPFAALEAIMCGTPIIVTDGTGAAEDVKKMECGLIVQFGDEKGFAINIDYLLSDISKGIAKLMVENGREYIRKNLAITEKVKEYEIMYKEVLA
jgi:glycosyltransferase involved in cell wall biosynthesis